MFRIRQIYNPGWELGADFWPNFRPIGGHSDNSAHSSRQKIIKSGSRYPFDSSLLHRLCIIVQPSPVQNILVSNKNVKKDWISAHGVQIGAPTYKWDYGGFVYRVLSSIYCRCHNILNVCILNGQLHVFLHDVEWMWSAKKGFHFDVDLQGYCMGWSVQDSWNYKV